MSEVFREEENLEENNVNTQTIKCAGCGSNMIFNPDAQLLECPYCGTKKQFGISVFADENDLISGLNSSKQWERENAVVFSCDNCGAKVVLKQGETALLCPFCGTSHVRETDELAGIKPHALIPFSFGEKKGIEYSIAWAKKRFFAPNKFKKNIKTDNVKGVYMPCFTFDSSTISYYEGRIGKTKTRVVGSGKNRRTETYVVWRNIRGTYLHGYDDLLITAGSKFSQKELDKISPFDTNNGKVYEEEFMLGFMAYHYDVELKDCWEDAKNKIDSDLRERILSQYSYDRVAYLNVSTTHENVKYKYIMLPIYLGNYKYGKKVYNFYVNGSTGKVYGKTPVSFWKVLFTVLGGIGLVALIIFLMHLGGVF